MALGMALGEVAAQVIVTLLTFSGWGYLLAALRLIPSPQGRFAGAIRVTAGLSAFTLFLLALTYANIPLRYSSWLALAVAATGWLARWRWPERCRTKSGLRDDYFAGALFLSIFLIQCIPVIRLGPCTYYGLGKIDQLNYIVVTQYLIEHPLTDIASPNPTEPWQQPALAVLNGNERLGQNMSLGYPAVILLSDPYRAYATISNLYLALLAVSCFVCLRCLRISTPFAWIGGFWIGIAHWMTLNTHVAYFSSLCVLFVAPMLVGLLWRYRRHPQSLRLYPALLLSYTLCTYPELTPFIAVVIGLLFLGLSSGRKWLFLRLAGITFALVVILSAPYLPHLHHFLQAQLSQACKIDPFIPENRGTWTGWRELFFADFNSNRLPWLNDFLSLVAMALIPIGLSGLFPLTKERNRYLTLLTLSISFWILLLLFISPFRSYIFFKLCITFLPLFIVLILVSFQRFWKITPRHWWSLRLVIGGSLAFLFGFSLLSTAYCYLTLIRLEGKMPCNAPAALQTYNYVRSHPEETYYLTDADRYRACWIAYHARHSKVYIQQEVLYPHWIFSNDNLQPPPPLPCTVIDGENPPRRIAVITK